MTLLEKLTKAFCPDEDNKTLAVRIWNGVIESYEGNSSLRWPNIKELLDEKDDKIKEILPLLAEMAEALELRRMHDDDCADATEKFKPTEMCECGASVVKEALSKLSAAMNVPASVEPRKKEE